MTYFFPASKVAKHVEGMSGLPCPPNLNIFWNFGFVIGAFVAVQIATGIMLAVHYTADTSLAFESVQYILREVNTGWIFRSMHFNGASFLFIMMFIHVGRGIFYHSFSFNPACWNVGVVMFYLMMGIAFSGYVLPWGQMSYWAATVIFNMLSAIPFIGHTLMEWAMGGFCVCDATLKRLYIFHMFCPFILLCLVAIHLVYLHGTGSSNPIGVDSDIEHVPFHSYYLLRDAQVFLLFQFIMWVVILCFPRLFENPDNWIPANPMITPEHIQPEWYFLFAYTILRSIESKGVGVLMMAMSVGVLFVMPFYPKFVIRGVQFNPLGQFVFWWFCWNFVYLSYLGSKPVEEPFGVHGKVCTFLYFFFFIIYPVSCLVWEWFMFSSFVTLVGSAKAKDIWVVSSLDSMNNMLNKSGYLPSDTSS